MCELSSTGSVTATNTFEANGLISRRSDSASTFDAQGSVAQRYTSTGNGDVFGYEGQAGYYAAVSVSLEF